MTPGTKKYNLTEHGEIKRFGTANGFSVAAQDVVSPESPGYLAIYERNLNEIFIQETLPAI